jgi:uncharacterized protein
MKRRDPHDSIGKISVAGTAMGPGRFSAQPLRPNLGGASGTLKNAIDREIAAGRIHPNDFISNMLTNARLDYSTLLYSGVHGSHAYGLAHDGSDIDLKFVFIAPNETLLGIIGEIEHISALAHDGFDYDATGYELNRYVSSLCKGDVNSLEMLHTEGDAILTTGDTFADLRANSHLFLSKQVIARYVGFAKGQARDIADGTQGSKEDSKRAKKQRHAARLLLQADSLLRTGEFHTVVKDVDRVKDFESMSREEFLEEFGKLAEWVSSTPSSLPEKSDMAGANDLLLQIRLSAA